MSGATRLPPSTMGNAAAIDTWTCRSPLSTFVRCLHLLDLDLLEDWPEITEGTFTSKVSQQNLQQRVRAAEWSLFRLFEIHSPRETQDKLRPFFPPLTSLQSLNLRAALLRCLTELKKTGALGRDIVIRKTMLDECKGDRFEELLCAFAMLALKSTLSQHGDREKLRGIDTVNVADARECIPLLLAYRASLQRSLKQRQLLQETLNGANEAITGDLAHLNGRKARALRRADGASGKDLRATVDQFRSTFAGASEWTNVVIHGGAPESGCASVEEQGVPSMLDNLDCHLRGHKDELSRWEGFSQSLPTQGSIKEQATMSRTNANPRPFFDRHTALVPLVEMDGPDHLRASEQESSPAYARLLNRMEIELRQADAPATLLQDSVPGPGSVSPRASITDLPTSSLQNQLDFPSLDASRSYAARITDIAAPPIQSSKAKPSPGPDESDFSWLDESPLKQSSGNMSNPRETFLGHGESQETAQGTSYGDVLEQQSLGKLDVSSVGEIEWQRASSKDTSNRTSVELVSRDSEDSPVDRRPPVSLLERTRQSMSLLAAVPGRRIARKNATNNRLSQFPVDQFETPERAAHPITPLSATSNASTPREQLFSDDADYASVFKTRPKIAPSPMLSPERSLFEDSIFEHESDQLNADN